MDLSQSHRDSGGSHGGGHSGHHGGGYDRHHRHTSSCGRWDWYFGLGYWGSHYSLGLGYWGLPYYSYYSPYYPYYTPYSPVVVYGDPQGALDLNVKPKTTEVFVDGYFVGTTGDFDGWPRYLWLSDDPHEIIFYLDGHETVVREVSVRAGEVIDMRFRMAPGPSTPPEEITRFGPAPSPAGTYASTAPPSAAPTPAPPSGPPAELDLRTEAGRVQLRISPGEASVYVDGRFVGIAGELAAVRDGLLMDPGEHTLQVFHPGHESVERPFVVEAGRTIELRVELRP